ncbi:DapH/DapD/GlmU-related protein [Cetobacterium sp.]|uniref:DapH/DapD/GlmU-related protein n=1 Tax=Cetobacterium sp. TaxID=2071632 RepID=UPI003F35ABD3
MDHNAHGVKPNERRTSVGTPKEVEIGKNVWIGSDVFILPGTKIGDNSIVGAGAVVSGIFPKNVIIMGNPGVMIKEIKE